MNSLWQTLENTGTGLLNALGLGKPAVKPFESKKPSRTADKDSLRWQQAWFGQWADERDRGVLVANHVRDEVGYYNAIGFAPHPVNVSFGELPATINTVPPADRHAYMSAPAELRAFKTVFDWRD